jgi:hypothetical protein
MSAPDQQTYVRAIAAAASGWQDPEYPPRAEAVSATLDAPNRFTEQALAFAINQQMAQLTPKAMQDWVRGRWAGTPQTVGVLNAGNIPLVGLQDLLAVVLTGHNYLGTLSSKSPHLLPAFVDEIKQHASAVPVSFVEAETLFDRAQALIATGRDDTMAWVQEQCKAHDIPLERRLLRGHRYGVAVIDGNENEDEREQLAEDMLLHEGAGCRNVAIVWAPTDSNPDPYLNAMARFRGVFPVHPELPGTLQMQQAFLEATDQPHAYGEGLEFLLSRGAPEPQRPGHIRWSEYESLNMVTEWLDAHACDVQHVTARSALASRLEGPLPVSPLGTAQRPTLDWQPDGQDTVGFLAQLERAATP